MLAKVSPFLEFLEPGQRIFSHSRHNPQVVGMQFEFQLLCQLFQYVM